MGQTISGTNSFVGGLSSGTNISLQLQTISEKPFSHHFLSSKPISLPTHSIHLEDYEEVTSPASFYSFDNGVVKLRKVRRVDNNNKNAIEGKECFAMKYITIKDEQSFKTYINEAEILCQLDHENVVKFIGYGIKEDKKLKILGILIEYFDENLSKLLNDRIAKQKPFSKDELISLINKLISGLLYLHSKRIFHANIQPENILISGDSVKFCNFSFSHDFSNERSTLLNDMTGGELNNNWSLFWSPEYKRALLENKSDVSFNAFKVDSFALGLLILQLACFCSIDKIYKMLETEEKAKIYKLIETKYNKAIVDLIKDLSTFDEDERKTVVSVCFAPKKSYQEIVEKEVLKTYNIRKTDRKLYKSLQSLGSGGYGEVHEVKNTKTNEKYAEKSIKMIDSRCLIDSMDEILINASMDHENIVHLYFYDIEEIPNRSDFFNIYCYTELMDRGLDYEIARRSKLTPKSHFKIEEIDDFLYSIAKAMKYMQEVQHTAHSDIKPHNILISADLKNYKLCDFGISRSNMPISAITAVRTIKGSPLYFAPELREVPEGHYPKTTYNPFKADIFSLGLTLLSMVTLENFGRNKEKEKEDCFGFFVNEMNRKKILEKYDNCVLDLLKEMLKFDFKERMDYVSFYKTIYERWKQRNLQGF